MGLSGWGSNHERAHEVSISVCRQVLFQGSVARTPECRSLCAGPCLPHRWIHMHDMQQLSSAVIDLAVYVYSPAQTVNSSFKTSVVE